MRNTIFLLLFPLLLSGCIGATILGNTEYLQEEFPDIRSVPPRSQAICTRGLHQGDEKVIRAQDLRALEQEREKTKARNEALRETSETILAVPVPALPETSLPGSSQEELKQELEQLKARDKALRDKGF